jgi:hypothetical protein
MMTMFRTLSSLTVAIVLVVLTGSWDGTTVVMVEAQQQQQQQQEEVECTLNCPENAPCRIGHADFSDRVVELGVTHINGMHCDCPVGKCDNVSNLTSTTISTTNNQQNVTGFEIADYEVQVVVLCD